MRWIRWWSLGVVVVIFAALGLAPQVGGRPDERMDSAAIDKIIEALGSDSFKEREDATRALDAIGLPALEKLRVAAKSPDAEIRKRAMGLVAKIETRAVGSRILTGRQVHLVYKDAPLREALADFSKKSGYPIHLSDPSNALKDRKITLDTGKTTFWDALEKVMDAAGLVEANAADGFIPVAPGFPGAVPGAAPAIGGVAPGFPGIAPAIEAPRGVDPAAAAKIAEKLKKLREEAEKRLKDAKKEGAAPAPAKPAVAKVVAEAVEEVIAVPGVAPALGPAIGVVPGLPPMAVMGFGGQPGQAIHLQPGKGVKLPSDTRSSVRVRVAPESIRPAMGDAPPGKIQVLLQATPEPRLRWQELVGITIEKAIDDNDQKLVAVPPEQPAPLIIGGPGVAAVGMPFFSHDGAGCNFRVVLEKGDKETKKLRTLEGTLTVRLLDDPKPHIEVKDVMKAKGTTVKGGKGGAITILSADKTADGAIRIAFEFEQPTDVIPEDGILPPFMAPAFPVPAPRIGRLPRPAVPLPGGKPIEVKPLPGEIKPAPPEKPVEDKPAAALAEDKPAVAPVPPPMVVEIKVGGGGVVVIGGGLVIGGGAIGGGPGIAMARPFGGSSSNGITLQDEKGNTLPIASSQVQFQIQAGGVPKMQTILTYKPSKGMPAEPSKLVFLGRSSVQVAIPFKLSNVELKK
ncbi:MAG: hypothetical protein EBV06_00190 [Planctomycetia bacterium]|nr:hypothetical protein [Planctomycetia bacterium]